MTDILISSAQLGAAATITVFVAARIYEIGQSLLLRARDRRRLIVTLLLEIEYNVAQTNKALATLPPIAEIKLFLDKDPENHLHWVFANHSRFYDSHVQSITKFRMAEIEQLMSFYHRLESIRADIDAMSNKSFEKLTHSGRHEVVDRIIADLQHCVSDGNSLAAMIRANYPSRWFKKIKSPTVARPPRTLLSLWFRRSDNQGTGRHLTNSSKTDPEIVAASPSRNATSKDDADGPASP